MKNSPLKNRNDNSPTTVGYSNDSWIEKFIRLSKTIESAHQRLHWTSSYISCSIQCILTPSTRVTTPMLQSYTILLASIVWARVLGFKTEKKNRFLQKLANFGKYRKFRSRFSCLTHQTNLFLNEIWIEIDGNLTIDHSGKWWGELGRYNEKLMRKRQNHISLAFDNYHKVRDAQKRFIIRIYYHFYT